MRCTAARSDLSFCDGPVPDGSPVSLCLKHIEEAAHYANYLASQPSRPISRPCPVCGATALKVSTARMTATCGACASNWRPGHNDQLRADREAGVVYYLRFVDRVKIGTTTRLAKRLTEIPHDELLATEPGGPRVERERHQQFADARVSGMTEWFYRSPALLEHIASLRREVVGHESPPPCTLED